MPSLDYRSVQSNSELECDSSVEETATVGKRKIEENKGRQKDSREEREEEKPALEVIWRSAQQEQRETLHSEREDVTKKAGIT